MESEQRKTIKKFIIENQDALFIRLLKEPFHVFSAIPELESLRTSEFQTFMGDEKELIKFILEDEEILNSLSMSNLNILRAKNNAQQETIISCIIHKINEGEHLCNGTRNEWDLFFTYEVAKGTLNEISKKVDMISKLKGDIARIKTENPEFFEYLKQTETYMAMDNMIAYYDRGILTASKLKILEEIIDGNPNTLNTINYGIFHDDIISMNQDFIKRIAKYMNESAELINIHKNAPKLFKILKQKIEYWEQNLSKRESMNLEKIILCKLAEYYFEMQDVTEEKFDDIIEFCMRVEYGEKNFLIEYSESYLDEWNEKCDEIFEKNAENFSLIPETLRKTRAEKMIESYCLKHFGITISEAKKTYYKLFESLDLTKIEDEDVRQYLIELKEMMNFDITSDEFYQIICQKFESEPRKNAARLYKHSTEVATVQIIQTFENKFKKTKEWFETTEDYDLVTYEGKTIKQKRLSGEYTIVLRSTDTGFKVEKKLIDDSIRKTEEQNPDPPANIKSGVLQTETFMGVSPLGENGTYFVYMDNNTNNVGEIGIYDLDSNIRNYGITSSTGKRMPYEELIKNSRAVYDETSIIARPPEAIALYNDATPRQRELAYKTALEYGIDVLYIDKDLIVQQQLERLDILIKRFSATNDLEILSELISMYETNIAGWLLNRDKENISEKSCTENIKNEKYMPAFEERENRIYEIIAEFCKEQRKMQNGNSELEKIKQILNREIAKYNLVEQIQALSRVKMKFQAESILERLEQNWEVSTDFDLTDLHKAKYLPAVINLTQIVEGALEKDMVASSDIARVEKIIEPDRGKEEVSL